MSRLTVLVLTLNEAPRIAACLASVRDLAADLLVVDSGSADGTQAIAAACGARVLERPWPGRAAQARWAIDQIGTPWLLLLDADERSTPDLNAAIGAAIDGAPATTAGFGLDRAERFLGRIIRCGYHRAMPRLCRTEQALCPERRAHAALAVAGDCPSLGPALLHEVDQPLAELFTKWLQRARLAALDRRDAGRRFSVWRLIWHPLAAGLRLLLLKGGWRDGVPGLIFCGLRVAYTFAREAHLYDLSRAAEPTPERARDGTA